VCLARVPRCGVCPLASACPARGSRFEPLRKQGPFEGSFRQKRAAALRRLSEAPQQVDELDGAAIEALVRDGLAEVEAGIARLPR
jgi:adenine-specific DNA glycosylase